MDTLPGDLVLEIRLLVKIAAIQFVGVEYAVGESAARTLANLVGQELYRKLVGTVSSFQELVERVEERTPLRFDVYESGKGLLYLVGRECPARQVYYSEGLEPCSLCRVLQRMLEQGLSQAIGGGRVRLELRRYGPNACFVAAEGPEVLERVPRYSSPKPSLEEYAAKLRSFLRELVAAVDSVAQRVLGSPAVFYMCGKRFGELDGMLLLSDYDEPLPLDNAVELLNKSTGLVRVEKAGDTYVAKQLYGAEYRSLQRFVMGYAAGVLGILTGKRVEFRLAPDGTGRMMVYAG